MLVPFLPLQHFGVIDVKTVKTVELLPKQMQFYNYFQGIVLENTRIPALHLYWLFNLLAYDEFKYPITMSFLQNTFDIALSSYIFEIILLIQTAQKYIESKVKALYFLFLSFEHFLI